MSEPADRIELPAELFAPADRERLATLAAAHRAALKELRDFLAFCLAVNPPAAEAGPQTPAPVGAPDVPEPPPAAPPQAAPQTPAVPAGYRPRTLNEALLYVLSGAPAALNAGQLLERLERLWPGLFMNPSHVRSVIYELTHRAHHSRPKVEVTDSELLPEPIYGITDDGQDYLNHLLGRDE